MPKNRRPKKIAKPKFYKGQKVTVATSWVMRDGELARPYAHIVGISKDNRRYLVQYLDSAQSFWAFESQLRATGCWLHDGDCTCDACLGYRE